MNKEQILKLIDQRIEEKLRQKIRTTKDGKNFFKPFKTQKRKKKVKKIHIELIDKIKNIRINSQKYPLVKNNDEVLVKCLFILDIVKNEARVEELTAPEIETVAPYFNKLKVSHQAARQALDRHPEYVSIRQEGPKKTFYGIKDEGIKYYRNKVIPKNE